MLIEPDDLPEHAGKQKVLIGEDEAERLDVTPATFRVIITPRPKYAFKGWDGIIQALAPPHIIENGLPSEALLAQIAVSKYAPSRDIATQCTAGQWMAKALRYAMTRREIFERFLIDGRIALVSNIGERAIRPQTITRNNSLFAGSDGGGRTWATLATLLQICKINDVDPVAWRTLALDRIVNQWPSAEIDALMPWNYTTPERQCLPAYA